MTKVEIRVYFKNKIPDNKPESFLFLPRWAESNSVQKTTEPRHKFLNQSPCLPGAIKYVRICVSLLFYHSLDLSGATKNSYIADCYLEPTWEGWASTTPGTKTFSWSLTSANCGSYSDWFNYTLEDGKSYYFQIELNANYDLVIYVYIGTASDATAAVTHNEQTELTTIENTGSSMQLTDTIKLNVPRDAFKGASCKK